MPAEIRQHMLAIAVLTLFLYKSAMAQPVTSRPESQPASASLHVYVGTYTTPQNDSKGIYRLDMDPASGKLGRPVIAGSTKNPSFLAIDSAVRFLYCVGEAATFRGKPSGAVTAFSISRETGKLTRLNQQPSGGAGPCYIALDPAGRHALVAHYTGGSVAALPIDDTGRLGEPSSVVQHQGSGLHQNRQAGPHAHSILFDATGRFAFAPDLGIDQIMLYRFDPATGQLTPNDPPSAHVAPGSGPRHFAFHPSNRFAYVVAELASTVTAFAYDAARGSLRELQTLSMLPKDFDGKTHAADIHVHPSGRFLYASNRGHDSIAIFSIAPDTGLLKVVGHESTQGKTPRNFGIDPSGRWLIAANQDSNSLVVFRIDPQTGRLTPAGSIAQIPSPVCVKFVLQQPE